MLGPKRVSFTRKLLSNSQANDLNEAAREWRINRIGYSEKYSPCLCCGTPIKRHAVIENYVTEATFIIGLTCLENLRCAQEGLDFPSYKGYISRSRTLLKGKIKQQYKYTPVTMKSWKNWFLTLEDIPDSLREGIIQLKHFGILPEELVDRFIDYHDDNRLFPREVLIPEEYCKFLKDHFGIVAANYIPDYLTIKRSRKYLGDPNDPIYDNDYEFYLIDSAISYLRKEGFKKCHECQLVVLPPAELNEHLIKKHNYEVCPLCNELCNIKKHLKDKHDSRLCPECNNVIKSDEFNNHLKQEHNYSEWTRCPICEVKVKDQNLDKHLKKVHQNKGSSKKDKKIKKHQHESFTCPICLRAVSARNFREHAAKCRISQMTGNIPARKYKSGDLKYRV